MVEKEDYLCTPTGRIKLTQRLSCANYGIYVATCLLCKEQHVGQTKNKFSVRWTAHRNNWTPVNTTISIRSVTKIAKITNIIKIAKTTKIAVITKINKNAKIRNGSCTLVWMQNNMFLDWICTVKS